MAQNKNKKRDTSSLKSIATAAGHLQNIELEDPAVLRILEVIAGKVNETEQCAFMESSKCQLFISKALVTSSRLESRAVGDILQTVLRGFVSKLVSQHFPKVGSMVREIFNNSNRKENWFGITNSREISNAYCGPNKEPQQYKRITSCNAANVQ